MSWREVYNTVRTLGARRVANALGSAALERFAQWVIATRPGDPSVPNSTDLPGMRGFVIYDRETGHPYMTRILFPRVLGARPMLQHIHRADYARDMHNHPYAWCVSAILLGAYDEERLHHIDKDLNEPVTTSKRCTWFNTLTSRTFHRITELHGNVWTLFVTGPRVQPWGFLEYDEADDTFKVTPNKEYAERFKR